MSSSETIASRRVSSARLGLIIAGLLCATALAGCSADLSRFDAANASLTQDAPRRHAALMPSEPIRRSNAGAPIDTEPTASTYSRNPGPLEPPAQSPSAVRVAGLPEPAMREADVRRQSDPPQRASVPPRRETLLPTRTQPSIADPAPAPIADATTIEVQQGDTVYGLAKRHRVSISELMSANNLQTPMIRPGQKLVLPAAHRQAPTRRPTKVASAPADGLATDAPSRLRAPSPTAPAVASEAPSSWTGTHTVTPRDSLYVLARRYNVKVADLQAANGISDPARLRAGTVLKVPGGNSHLEVAPPAASSEITEEGGAALPGSIRKPTIINAGGHAEPAPDRVAAVTPPSPVINDANPEPVAKSRTQSAAPGKFRWPVKGRVIANFGPRSDNTQNDGINILVPQGTSVVAAESGVVAYAGSELKGYGNLVLIRHEGNWVSAYAHNEALLVKRGDKVERGQQIAKAGKTGAVDQPQVHFELRQGSKPVDPMPHLER